jgi:hypothetical protein
MSLVGTPLSEDQKREFFRALDTARSSRGYSYAEIKAARDRAAAWKTLADYHLSECHLLMVAHRKLQQEYEQLQQLMESA